MSDSRVTDDDTGQILMEALTDEKGQPIWLGQLEVLRSEHPKQILPGEMGGFGGFDNLIDLLQVQIVTVDTKPDRYVLQLGAKKPKTSQRIEDIKRNLTRLEIENNPSAPA